jgi:hypothetical protein
VLALSPREDYLPVMQKVLVLALLFLPFFSFGVELPEPNVPNKEALNGWQKKPYPIDELDFSKLTAKPFACADKMLEPMSQDQSTKQYHKFVWSDYDLAKLKGTSEVCRVPQKSNANYCLRADTIEYTVMSDIYKDSCGNSYRGFWEVVFLTEDESMGTLCSLGRTFYEIPNSPGEIEIGPTYKVPAERFLFFSEIF